MAPVVEETKATVNGTKRPREEETPTGTRSVPQVEPVAKKPKRDEWDGPISEEVEKRQQELNNLETNRGAQNLLARAADDLLVGGATQMGDTTAGNPGEGMSKELQDFLSSGPLFGIPDPFQISQIYGEVTKFGDLSPSAENSIDFLDSLVDFSKCAQDDPIPSSSKFDPPDLVHSSANPSTNPSPESAAETPKHENASINSKHRDGVLKIVDDSSMYNPLDHSLWTELNNGEPAYYEHTNFKFDGELPTQENPWAISGGA